MDVSLTTNRPDASLEFRNVRRFADGSGFATLLIISAAPFAARLPFYFEPHSLNVFVSELQALNRCLSGTATLKPMWEAPFIRLDGDGHGHIHVSGELADQDQLLRFVFTTDQTCIEPLIRDLQGWSVLPAV